MLELIRGPYSAGTIVGMRIHNIFAVWLLMILASCSSTASVVDLDVWLTLQPPDVERLGGDSCRGSGSYADISSTTVVTVRDAAGGLVASADLDAAGLNEQGECIYRSTLRLPVVEQARYVVTIDDRPILFFGQVFDLDTDFLLSGLPLGLSSNSDGDIEALGRA